jgi:hypothetical protein
MDDCKAKEYAHGPQMQYPQLEFSQYPLTLNIPTTHLSTTHSRTLLADVRHALLHRVLRLHHELALF